MKALAILIALTAVAHAHKPSDAHVQIAVDGDRLTGTAAFALRDLDGALDLDADGNGDITWREASAAAPRIAAYAHDRLKIADCELAFGSGSLSDYSDGAYWSMPLTGSCSAETLEITYSVLFDIDAQHRGIVHVRSAHGAQTVIVRDATPFSVDIGDAGALGGVAAGFASVWTNLAGLACLACLVIPALIDRKRKAWSVVPARVAARTVRSSVAAFVLASAAMTLAATVGVIALPEHLVTVGVILTVAIAAGVNFYRPTGARWDLAFELGLLHGVAASFVIGALAPTRVSTILGFATGLAAGELVVASLLALALYAARGVLARRFVVLGGSAATVAAAIIWACSIA